MKVSVSQFASGPDVAANLTTVLHHIEVAAGQNARLIAFPEASMVAFASTRDELRIHAEQWSAEFVQQVAQAARKHGIDVFVGVYEPNGEPRSSNVIVHATAAGIIAGRYEKVHLYDAFNFRESDKNRAAAVSPSHQEVYVADVEGIKFALLNCYDLRFPEIARLALDKGADALVYGAGWIAGSLKELHWETLLKARAIENTAFVLGSCQPPPESVGMSMIVDPNGLTLAGVAANCGIATANIELDRLREVREVLPCLAHRRYRVTAA
ncbi:nitrilase-related carbon-nitrogen hydrolase [Achromobacter mucicolens]|uniref:nitrilase-related carbon-nitrogen hydrolase n=1 Tax=Achromobacter mucicolens TaxID=1389922 RepID=UPI0015815CB6|nr:nitrilase-related carbon-nitrogen hydrolase [Achromobacter mucicolens]